MHEAKTRQRQKRETVKEDEAEVAEEEETEGGGGGCQRFRGMSVFVHGNRQRRSAYANNRVARVARARRVPWVNGQEGV